MKRHQRMKVEAERAKQAIREWQKEREGKDGRQIGFKINEVGQREGEKERKAMDIWKRERKQSDRTESQITRKQEER